MSTIFSLRYLEMFVRDYCECRISQPLPYHTRYEEGRILFVFSLILSLLSMH